MHELDLANLDLNLLKIFSALAEEGSVTAAAERLKLAQSTVSHSLAHLRRAFNDPLFVRRTRGVQPTALAIALTDPVARALAILQEAINQQRAFDPSTSTRTFNLLLTDVCEVLFMPALMARIRKLGPRIRVVVQQLPRQNYKEALEEGNADLAIGQLPHGQTDLIQQVLSVEPFTGYARVGHPILARPDMESFLAADHLIVGIPAASGTHTQRALGHLAAKRRVALELCHYMPAAAVIAETDLVAVLPRTLSDFIPSFRALARFNPPYTIEPILLRQFWHSRSTNDEGCRWLRSHVANLFMSSSTSLSTGTRIAC